jgi:RNA-directed DNA polymerase
MLQTLGAVTAFIHEPKRRRSVPRRFVDRVVHHALCRVIEPICFEAQEDLLHRRQLRQSRGKGTHRAVDRCSTSRVSSSLRAARRYRQHFPSLDHALLRGKLARVIDDADCCGWPTSSSPAAPACSTD